MSADFLHRRLQGFENRPALVGPEGETRYCGLIERIAELRHWLGENRVRRGDCVVFCSSYGADDVALFLALALGAQIAALCGPEDTATLERFAAAAHADFLVRRDSAGGLVCERRNPSGHPLLDQLREGGQAGLVLFSSGSTGAPKATLLSLDRMFARHNEPRLAQTTLGFLDSSHIGGVNTMLFTLCHGACLVIPDERTPAAVCRAIARHGVSLLPTTPTFLNLLLMSDEIARNDLSSLRVVTYGTECMPPATLRALAAALPGVRLKQTYGSTELGIIPTRSHDDGSCWMNAGGGGFDLDIRDGHLFARSPEQMLGYLNAPSAVNADGWYDTGDLVEERDGMIRIIGRASEVINVGGQKVLPGEVENCLLQAGNVLDAVVEGRPNPVTGHAVTARVRLREQEGEEKAEARIWAFCTARLEEYKRPVLIQFTLQPLHSARFKRRRQVTA